MSVSMCVCSVMIVVNYHWCLAELVSKVMFIFFLFLQPSLFHSSLGAASENVLVHQMFQCKLTQTGSLVPSNQSLHLRRSKGTLLLHMPSSASTRKDGQKYLELKKVHILQKINWQIIHSPFWRIILLGSCAILWLCECTKCTPKPFTNKPV